MLWRLRASQRRSCRSGRRTSRRFPGSQAKATLRARAAGPRSARLIEMIRPLALACSSGVRRFMAAVEGSSRRLSRTIDDAPVEGPPPPSRRPSGSGCSDDGGAGGEDVESVFTAGPEDDEGGVRPRLGGAADLHHPVPDDFLALRGRSLSKQVCKLSRSFHHGHLAERQARAGERIVAIRKLTDQQEPRRLKPSGGAPSPLSQSRAASCNRLMHGAALRRRRASCGGQPPVRWILGSSDEQRSLYQAASSPRGPRCLSKTSTAASRRSSTPTTPETARR